MKKIIVLFTALLLALGAAACGSGESQKPTASGAKTESAAPSVKKGGKVLVVYFSGTGHTRSVAKTIAEAVHGDLWELQPVQPYTEADLNYRDKSSRVVKEHDNPSLQEQVALTNAKPANWDTYSTVFIGYPIWWHLAAWPVKDFVKANAFSGKTVIPFATSVESGMGESGTQLQQLAGTGTWLEGKRFPSNVAAKDVQDWVYSLGL